MCCKGEVSFTTVVVIFFLVTCLFFVENFYSHEEKSRSKLSIHTSFVNGGKYSWEFIKGGKPRCVKLLDRFDVAREIKNLVPGIVIIGRIWKGSHGSVLDGDPVERAREWWSVQGATIKLYPEVDYWEGYNEPGYLNPVEMAWYAEFEAERVRILSNHGRRACIGNFATGNIDTPDVDGGASWRAFEKALDAALLHGGVLGLHEYGCPMSCAFSGDVSTGEGWLCGRYRKVYKYYLIPNDKVIPLVITECGVDNVGNVSGCCSYSGWKLGYSWLEYINQLIWYDSILKVDDYVIGATIFSLEIPGWENYDIGVPELMFWLTKYVATGEAPPSKMSDDMMPPPTPKIYSPADNVVITSFPVVFSWSEVDDTDTGGSDPCFYELQVDDDFNFSVPDIIQPWLPERKYSLSFIPNGTYYWRVRAKDSVGNASSWSEKHTVIVDAAVVDTSPVVLKLQNGTFEEGLSGWTSHYLVPATYSIDTSVAHRGNSSAKIHCSVPTGAHFWQATPESSITPGQWYKFSVWVKTEDVVKCMPVGAALRISWANNDFTRFYGDCHVEGSTGTTTGWSKLEMVVQAPFGAERAQVALLLENATGSVWFDDVNVEENVAPVVLPVLTADITPPPTPILKKPPNGYIIKSLPYIFEWSRVDDNATGGSNPCTYHIQIDDSQEFDSPEVDESGLIESRYYLIVGGLRSSSIYYWRVSAEDSVGNKSSWSKVYKVTIKLRSGRCNKVER